MVPIRAVVQLLWGIKTRAEPCQDPLQRGKGFGRGGVPHALGCGTRAHGGPGVARHCVPGVEMLSLQTG